MRMRSCPRRPAPTPTPSMPLSLHPRSCLVRCPVAWAVQRHRVAPSLSSRLAPLLAPLRRRRRRPVSARGHAAVHGHEGAAAGLAAVSPGRLPVRPRPPAHPAAMLSQPRLSARTLGSRSAQAAACTDWLRARPASAPAARRSPRKPPEDEREIKRDEEIKKLPPNEQAVQVRLPCAPGPPSTVLQASPAKR